MDKRLNFVHAEGLWRQQFSWQPQHMKRKVIKVIGTALYGACLLSRDAAAGAPKHNWWVFLCPVAQCGLQSLENPDKWTCKLSTDEKNTPGAMAGGRFQIIDKGDEVDVHDVDQASSDFPHGDLHFFRSEAACLAKLPAWRDELRRYNAEEEKYR
jgi:hypothetical protein